MKIELIITRKVLFEKFNIKHEMNVFFLSFLEGCEIKISDKYQDFVFYVKNDLILFQQELKNRYFWVKYDLIWSVFESKYELNYAETQLFIKDILETHIKLEGYTPCFGDSVHLFKLETHIKLEGYTPITQKSKTLSDWKHI